MAASDLAWTLNADLESKFRARLAELRQQDVLRRIWAADPFVWTGGDEDRWLGWLNLPVEERPQLDRIAHFADGLGREQMSDIVLLGMGGSSLARQVSQTILGKHEGRPALHVLDSTDPAQILGLERRIDYRRSIFLVA